MNDATKREQEALIEGQQAGRLLLPAALNPFPFGTTEHSEWERGRLTAIAQYARRVA